MAVEGGMKCVKFLLYVLLLAFCVSSVGRATGRAGGMRGSLGAVAVKGEGPRNEGSWRPDVEKKPGERAKGRTCPRYPSSSSSPPTSALLFGTSEESLDRELPS